MSMVSIPRVQVATPLPSVPELTTCIVAPRSPLEVTSKHLKVVRGGPRNESKSMQVVTFRTQGMPWKIEPKARCKIWPDH